MIHATRSAIVLGGLAIALGGGGCVDIVGAGGGFAQYTERDEKRFSVTGTPDVTLSTFDGSIEIRPWDRSEVQVVVEKRARDKEAAATIEIHTQQNGNSIVIDAKVPRGDHGIGFGWNLSRSAKLIVSMPATSNVHARSGDGSIDIERITGKVELRSGDGSISGRDLKGDLTAHTGDGSIRLDNVSGPLDVDTGDGSVVVGGTLSTVRAKSGDGSITIHAGPGSATSADWDIRTGDGSVTVELPADFSGELDAHTGDGRIHMQDFTVTATGEIGRRTVRGRIGSGGHALRVRTGDGSITLRRF